MNTIGNSTRKFQVGDRVYRHHYGHKGTVVGYLLGQVVYESATGMHRELNAASLWDHCPEDELQPANCPTCGRPNYEG